MSKKARFLAATCSVALFQIASTAHAQDTAQVAAQGAAQASGQPSAASEIIVTGSRIQSAGFKQPTPVTVVGADTLQQKMQPTVADALNQLPSFGPPAGGRNPSPFASGEGISLLNLRSLGTQRTLVLLDGRRVVNSTISTGVDINTLPNTLVQRVDIVTGGASAAYGADAVAGVVNFVLNKKYRGFEVAVQGGQADGGLNPNGKVDATFGKELFGGKGSIVASFTYNYQPDIVRAGQLKWWPGYNAVVNNPAYAPGNGQPRQITIRDAGLANNSTGGVIISGPLAGSQFVGQGNLVPYNGGYRSGLLQEGGDLELSTARNRNVSLPLKYTSAFAHMDYELTDTITAYVEGSYGRSIVRNDTTFPNRQGIVVNADNPFLPASVQQALAAAGQTSFTMNKVLTEYPQAPGSSNRRTLWRGVAGLDGKIGSWKWGAYYQHGNVVSYSPNFGIPLLPRLAQATDAVRVTPANVGNSGLAVGSIACRSTLTNPGNGCSPYNLFGNGVASTQALDYVFTPAAFQKYTLKQDFVSAEASGPLFHLPAGAVNLAIGADYDRDSAVGTEDPRSRARQYLYGNFQDFRGAVNFKEVFGELNVPLLKDAPLARDLSLNAAGRMTDYSTSGLVWTWKVGLTDQITSELRPRFTISRDIRAPDLNSLFVQGFANALNLFDPVTQRSYAALPGIVNGNPNLQPEKADTITVGAAYSPKWLPGLNFSVDYYHIRVKGAIAPLAGDQVLSGCLAGSASLCSQITRAPDGTLLQITTMPINTNSMKTSGVDFEASYRHGILNGMLNIRALATYQPQLDIDYPATGIAHYAGSLEDIVLGSPKWKGQVSANYVQGPASITAQVRYIGSGVLVNTWVQGVDVDNNHVPAVAYLDMFGSYNFDVGPTKLTLSVAVNNVLDRAPPRIAATTNEGTDYGAGSWPGTRLDLYDALGRSFTVGLRAKF
jgi:iron complex outermembrane recepter protein